ncbi:ulp1 protease family protein [Colletotrichum tofieldiae]|nr:Ulp1 protease family protein [Colletotrichum tofieldiae]GKT81166.1 ulp1 protease family protein [Colletotrichum tofieldiae]GKT97322.1 ulp1 protease family protein [Colletotrichum tofieldiae]
MTPQDTLEQLNDAEDSDIERIIVRLWKQLQVDFESDAAHRGDDFARWSFSNFSRKILRIAVDQTLAPQVATIADECRRRIATTLERLDMSLALLILLFGTTVVSSRVCMGTLVTIFKNRLSSSCLHSTTPIVPRLVNRV